MVYELLLNVNQVGSRPRTDDVTQASSRRADEGGAESPAKVFEPGENRQIVKTF